MYIHGLGYREDITLHADHTPPAFRHVKFLELDAFECIILQKCINSLSANRSFFLVVLLLDTGSG